MLAWNGQLHVCMYKHRVDLLCTFVYGGPRETRRHKMRVTKSPPPKDTGPKNARTKEFEQEAFPNEKLMDVYFTKLLPAFRFLGGTAGVTVPNFPEASGNLGLIDARKDSSLMTLVLSPSPEAGIGIKPREKTFRYIFLVQRLVWRLTTSPLS